MIVVPSPAWHAHAACLGHPPDLFFPDHRNCIRQVRQAKAICATCPVTSECLAFALEQDETFGIFGGLTPVERGAVRSRRIVRPDRAPSASSHTAVSAVGVPSHDVAPLGVVTPWLERQRSNHAADAARQGEIRRPDGSRAPSGGRGAGVPACPPAPHHRGAS
jgi:WhiB family redox-sensing transcriptional regulator